MYIVMVRTGEQGITLMFCQLKEVNWSNNLIYTAQRRLACNKEGCVGFTFGHTCNCLIGTAVVVLSQKAL